MALIPLNPSPICSPRPVRAVRVGELAPLTPSPSLEGFIMPKLESERAASVSGSSTMVAAAAVVDSQKSSLIPLPPTPSSPPPSTELSPIPPPPSSSPSSSSPPPSSLAPEKEPLKEVEATEILQVEPNQFIVDMELHKHSHPIIHTILTTALPMIASIGLIVAGALGAGLITGLLAGGSLLVLTGIVYLGYKYYTDHLPEDVRRATNNEIDRVLRENNQQRETSDEQSTRVSLEPPSAPKRVVLEDSRLEEARKDFIQKHIQAHLDPKLRKGLEQVTEKYVQLLREKIEALCSNGLDLADEDDKEEIEQVLDQIHAEFLAIKNDSSLNEEYYDNKFERVDLPKVLLDRLIEKLNKNMPVSVIEFLSNKARELNEHDIEQFIAISAGEQTNERFNELVDKIVNRPFSSFNGYYARRYCLYKFGESIQESIEVLQQQRDQQNIPLQELQKNEEYLQHIIAELTQHQTQLSQFKTERDAINNEIESIQRQIDEIRAQNITKEKICFNNWGAILGDVERIQTQLHRLLQAKGEQASILANLIQSEAPIVRQSIDAQREKEALEESIERDRQNMPSITKVINSLALKIEALEWMEKVEVAKRARFMYI